MHVHACTRMLINRIFKQLMTFVVVPDVYSKFRRQGMCSSSDEVCDVSITCNYILLSVTYNFGLGK